MLAVFFENYWTNLQKYDNKPYTERISVKVEQGFISLRPYNLSNYGNKKPLDTRWPNISTSFKPNSHFKPPNLRPSSIIA